MCEDKNEAPAPVYDAYAKDARIKEEYKSVVGKVEDSVRMRMDESKAYENQTGQIETSDQEKTRLTRLLYASVQDREMQIRSLRSILINLEGRQKEAYFLLESVSQSSSIQRDQVREMRKHLTSY